jgi:uncharacterized membrane protein YphA (DoxX/SURF4 family)
MKKELIVIGLLELVLAYEWLAAAWEKFANPDFMQHLSQTLSAFASKNPYNFYTNFVNSTVIPNSQLFGNLIRFSEFLAGLSLVVAAFWAISRQKPVGPSFWIVMAGLLLGFLLNINFFLAAGQALQPRESTSLWVLPKPYCSHTICWNRSAAAAELKNCYDLPSLSFRGILAS